MLLTITYKGTETQDLGYLLFKNPSRTQAVPFSMGKACVNDRPYVASSFMTNAINRVFGTAMTGRCDARPHLAASEIDLTVKKYMLPVRDEISPAQMGG